MEMEQLLGLAGIAVAATLLGMVVKKYVPQIAMLLTLAAGIFILTALLSQVGELVGQLRGIAGVTEGMEESFAPLVKVMGISVISRVSSQVCVDAGERALASKVELAGMVAALAVTLPLAASVIRTITTML